MKRFSFLVYNIFFVLLCFLFSSCSNNLKRNRYDLSNFVFYLEAPQEQQYGQIMGRQEEFKKLEKNQMNKLSNLVSKDGNMLWLRIQFSLPEELKGKDIGLYIGHLRSASMLFMNNNGIRKYGEFPPNENTAGYTTQYFMFPKNIVNQNGLNTVMIQVWPGAFGSLSSKIFINEQPDIFHTAERDTFFNSKIIVCFAGIMLLVFFMYLFLYIIMHKFPNSAVYLFYALLNFYTIHFLVPIYISEISWAKPGFISYYAMLKIFFFGGAFTTVYFANSFIIAYLKYKDSKPVIITRIVLWIVPMLITFAIPNYKLLPKFLPYLIILALSQFCFSIPRIFMALKDKDKKKIAIKMLFGFSPVIAGLIADIILKVFRVNPDLSYITIYGWQITIYLFLSDLLIQFGSTYRHNTLLKDQLSEFNSHLEDVVALRTKELSEANYVLSKGLETVAHVQKNFLPQKNKTFRGWELAISYNALDNNVSGDLYDYYFTEGILDGMGIFDVSGHGIPAGLMTILAKSIISQHFITGKTQDESMSNVLKDINKSYIKEKVNVENYITGLLFRFSEFNKKDVCSVEFANAGHPYPLLYSAEQDKIIELKQEEEKQYGILGVEGLDVSFPPVNFRAAQNDIIICYTDGLTDCLNNHGEEFGKERIFKIVQQYHKESAIMLMNRIMDKFSDFIGSEKISDDITLIVLKRVNSNDYIEEI